MNREKYIAVVHIPGGAKLTSNNVARIVNWLREEATFIKKHGHNLAMRYRSRLMVIPKPRSPKKSRRRS